MRPQAFLRSLVVGVGLGLTLAGGSGGCFHPREPPCAFTCVSPGARCPTDFTCGADGLCHRDGAEGVCTLTPPDGGAGAAGAGGAVEGAGGGAGAAGNGGGAGAGGASGGPGGVAGAGV